MTRLKITVRTWAAQQSGAAMVEYALVLLVVAIAAVLAFQALGGSVSGMAQGTADSFPGGTN